MKQFRPRLNESEWQVIQNLRSKKSSQINGAKVLIFDIETSPLRSYVWSIWKETRSMNQVLTDWFMLTWSAKWLFSDEILHDALTPQEAISENDRRITSSIWKLLDEADIVISHNGDKFDIKRVNTRFLKYGLNSPSYYQSIDTLKHARRQFSVSSNRLDYLGEFLGVGQKMETGGFDLWKHFLQGDQESIDKMVEYCDQDVRLLEDVYLKLRPYIKPHPNMSLFIGDNIERCPTCGSDKLEDNGEYFTYVNVYQALRCKNCGSQSRSRKSLTSLKEYSNIKTSLPR